MNVPAICLALLAGSLQADFIPLECPVTSVRMHAQQTHIMRTATVDIPTGSSNWFCTHLPASLTEGDLQIAVSGESSRVTGFALEPWDPATDPRIANALEEIAFHRERLERDTLELALKRQHLAFFADIVSAIPQTRESTPATAIAEINHFAEASAQTRRELLAEIAEIQSRLDEIQHAIDLNERLIEERRQAISPFGQAVHITLGTDTDTTATLSLSYWCKQATWTPAPTLSLTSGASSMPISFEAAISQNTGLDWPAGTQLSLSNIPGTDPFKTDPDNLWELTVILPETIKNAAGSPSLVPVLFTTNSASISLETHPKLEHLSQLHIRFRTSFPQQFSGALARIQCDDNILGTYEVLPTDKKNTFSLTLPWPEGFSLEDPVRRRHQPDL